MISLVEIGPVFLEKNIFKICQLSPLGKGRGLHLNKLESPSPKDALCQVLLNWPSGSGEEDLNVKSLRQRQQRRLQRRRTTDKF